MRIHRSLVALSLIALVAVPAAAQVSAEALAKLEAKHRSSPNNVSTSRALGIAYFKNKKYADASAVLSDAQKRSKKDGVIALYLGMSAEEQGDLTAARAAYTTYLAVGRTASARADVSNRLAAVAQRELQANAKATVAQEQRLASQPGPANTIAVLPLNVNTTNPDYVALGRGLADLMITDLRKKREITVVERDHIQALLDEIALGQTNRVDQGTAARSGRLLQAGRVVQGSVNFTGPTTLRIDEQVIDVATAGTVPTRPSEGTLDRLFDLEKRTVIAVIEGMGFPLTAAERNAINVKSTENVQAFLAYSRGLVAQDAGRLDEAASFFDNARALDPGFGAAVQHSNDAHAAQQGASITTGTIESKLRGGSEGQIVNAAERGATSGGSETIGSTLSSALSDVNPSTADAIGRPATTASARDASTSTTAQDQATTRTGTLTIVIKRP